MFRTLPRRFEATDQFFLISPLQKSDFATHIAHSAREVVFWLFAVRKGDEFDWAGIVVRTKDQAVFREFDVTNQAGFVFHDCVEIWFSLAIWAKRIVVAVDEESGSEGKAGMHCGGFAWFQPDEDESLPRQAVVVRIGPDAMKERLLELQDFFDVHADDQRLGGSDEGVSKNDVLKVVGTGRQNGGALVDLGGIEQIEHGEVLDLENFVHAFKAESALAVEEVGDVGLFESSLVGEAESG